MGGGGAAAADSSLTVVATPMSGYNFAGWTDHGITVSTYPSYTFTVSGTRALAAAFIAAPVSGGVMAWGQGTNNTGTPPNSGESLVPAEAQSEVIAIAAGLLHTLALKSDGSVLAWGWNAYGQSTVPANASTGVTEVGFGA